MYVPLLSEPLTLYCRENIVDMHLCQLYFCSKPVNICCSDDLPSQCCSQIFDPQRKGQKHYIEDLCDQETSKVTQAQYSYNQFFPNPINPNILIYPLLFPTLCRPSSTT